MVSEDQFKVERLHNSYNDAINITLGSTLVPKASASIDSRFSTDSPDPKNRIGDYYQEEGKYYKVTALGPQEVSLSEVINERVWADDNKGRAGWWTVREDGLIEWAGMTGEFRVAGDNLWQIGPNGKDNYKGVRVQELVKTN